MSFLRETLLGLPTATRSATEVERAEQSDPAPGAMPPRRDAAGNVTVLRAATLPSVFRALQIITTAVSQLQLTGWRGEEQLVPTPLVLQQPDLDRTLSSFLKRTTLNLASRGNAYWWVKRTDRGALASLSVLATRGITWHYDTNGRKVWHYAGKVGGRHISRTFSDEEVQPLRFLELEDLDEGLGPIQACRANLSGAIDVRDYGSNWFENTDVPSGLLTTEGTISPSQAKEVKDGWRENNREYGVSVLGNGLRYQQLLLKPSDAQWLESQNFSVTEVARMFGIHPALLAAAVEGGTSMTYTTLEQIDTQQTRTTYMTYVQEIQDNLTLLLPRGQSARLPVQDLERSDNQTRAEIHKTYVDLKVMTREEVRLREGLGPMPEELKAAPAPAKPTLAAVPSDPDAEEQSA